MCETNLVSSHERQASMLDSISNSWWRPPNTTGEEASLVQLYQESSANDRSTALEKKQMAPTDLARRDGRPIAAGARPQMVLSRLTRSGNLSQPSGRSVPELFPRRGIGLCGHRRARFVSEPDERLADICALVRHIGIVLECGRTQAGTDDESVSEPTGGEYGSAVGRNPEPRETSFFGGEGGVSRMRLSRVKWVGRCGGYGNDV